MKKYNVFCLLVPQKQSVVTAAFTGFIACNHMSIQTSLSLTTHTQKYKYLVYTHLKTHDGYQAVYRADTRPDNGPKH